MRARAHVLIGAYAAVAMAIPFTMKSSGGGVLNLVLMPIGAVGALLPDIDHPGSPLGRFLPWPKAEETGEMPRHGRRWFGGRILWHRGELHSIGGVALLSLAAGILWLAPLIWLSHAVPPSMPLPIIAGIDCFLSLGVFVGGISHLLADMTTPSPQMLFWPFSRRMVHGWRPPDAIASWVIEWVACFGVILGVQWLEHFAAWYHPVQILPLSPWLPIFLLGGLLRMWLKPRRQPRRRRRPTELGVIENA